MDSRPDRSIRHILAQARASVSDHSMRPMTAGRQAAGFALRNNANQTQEREEVRPVTMENKTASLLNPSRPYTAASSRRSQGVFANDQMDQVQEPQVTSKFGKTVNQARPSTSYRPVTNVLGLGMRGAVSSMSQTPTAPARPDSASGRRENNGLSRTSMEAQQRRPQTASTGGRPNTLPNSYANEISALLTAANSLATNWLERREDTAESMPHQEDSSEVHNLYDRAGKLLSNVVHPAELVKLCRLILLLPYDPESRNVFVSCTLKLFDLSRKYTNDIFFHQESLFEPLIQVLAHASMYSFEEVSYGISSVLGTIRNLAVDTTSQVIICKNNGIKAVSNLLKEEVCDALIQDQVTKEKVLIEVTGVLRNLAVVKKFQKDFSGVVELLCGLMFRFPMNPSLMLNVTRIVSKLSLHQFCRAAISSYAPNIEVLLQLLAIHDSNLALAVRVCFILGNLTVSNDENRKRIGLEYSGSAIALSVLDLAVYRDTDLAEKISRISKSSDSGDIVPRSDDEDDDRDVDEEDADLADEALDEFDCEENKEARLKKLNALRLQYKDNEDLLVKLIRLIGNMGINPNVGSVLSRHPTASVLIDLLSTKSSQVSRCEELVLNIVATITNLSFYQHQTNVFYANQKHIQRFLLPLLFSENQEMVMESVRALGNFSRDGDFRRDMMQTRGDEAMIILLDHSELQVVFAVCGVLVNLSSDLNHRNFITQRSSLTKLIEVLERGSEELPEGSALSVITVVSKVFINLCLDAPPAQSTNIQTAVDANEEILASSSSNGDSLVRVAVKPVWLESDLHERLFLQLQDILGQLPSDHESLKEFISKEGRSGDWEEILRDVASVCTSLLDLIGEPESLHDTFQSNDFDMTNQFPMDSYENNEVDEDLFGDDQEGLDDMDRFEQENGESDLSDD